MNTPYDSVHFLKVVNETLRDYKATPDSKKVTCEHLSQQKLTSNFFRQQELVGQFINDETPYRGLHLFWGLGTGKTGAAIKISENSKKRKVVYLIPTKGLLSEVYDQLSIFGDQSYRKASNYDYMSQLEKEAELERIKKEINKRYSIITYNSSKIINKLYAMGSIESKMTLEDIMDNKVNYTEKNPLNGKLIIIDEVHNMLRQMIAEGSKTGSALFHMIMEARDIKIVTLSGTPIADDPFNLAALFNMLRGYIRVGPETFTLFPSDYQQFVNYFIDEDTNRIKNEKVFSERITGLVSFYHGIYDESSELFPSSKEHIVNCVMSPYQQSAYNEVRKKEIRAERNSRQIKKQQIKSNWKKPGRSSAISSYRMNSRQKCNFVFPEYIERPTNLHLMNGETKRIEILKAINALKPDDINPSKNLRIYSEKMYQIVTRILASTGPVLVYSQFIELEGLGILAKILAHHGFKNWSHSAEGPKFAYFTGKTRLKHKEILDKFNNPNNSDGSKIKVLFINVVGIEGLNLRGVREIHYMEEYWFEDRYKQVRGRGIRTCSHWHLPPEERHVDIYRYHSVPNNKEDFLILTGEHETTDQYLYNLSKRRAKLSDSFLEVLKYSAFDCELNYEHNKSALTKPCPKCFADPESNRKMYPADIKLHMSPGNSFGCVATKQLRLKKVIHEGIEYLYDETTKKYYRRNENGVAVENEGPGVFF